MAGMALFARALLVGSEKAVLAGTAGMILGIKLAILLARRAGVTDQPQWRDRGRTPAPPPEQRPRLTRS